MQERLTSRHRLQPVDRRLRSQNMRNHTNFFVTYPLVFHLDCLMISLRLYLVYISLSHSPSYHLSIDVQKFFNTNNYILNIILIYSCHLS